MTDISDSALEAALDEWLDGALDEIGDVPANQEQADRLARALQGVRRRRAAVVELAERRMDEIRTWLTQQTDQLDTRAGHLEQQLESWALAENERTDRKTWKLPNATVRVRPRRPRTAMDPAMDHEAIVEAVASLTGPGLLPASAIKVERSVVLSQVKERTSPGEPVEGYEAPEGYEAREAIMRMDIGSPGSVRRAVPGVVLLVPKAGREGKAVTVS